MSAAVAPGQLELFALEPVVTASTATKFDWAAFWAERELDFAREQAAEASARARLTALPADHPLRAACLALAEAHLNKGQTVPDTTWAFACQVAHLAGQWTPYCAQDELAAMPWNTLDGAA